MERKLCFCGITIFESVFLFFFFLLLLERERERVQEDRWNGWRRFIKFKLNLHTEKGTEVSFSLCKYSPYYEKPSKLSPNGNVPHCPRADCTETLRLKYSV